MTVSTQWLLSENMYAQYVLCSHMCLHCMHREDSFAGSLIVFGIVNV